MSRKRPLPTQPAEPPKKADPPADSEPPVNPDLRIVDEDAKATGSRAAELMGQYPGMKGDQAIAISAEEDTAIEFAEEVLKLAKRFREANGTAQRFVLFMPSLIHRGSASVMYQSPCPSEMTFAISQIAMMAGAHVSQMEQTINAKSQEAHAGSAAGTQDGQANAAGRIVTP